MSQVLYGILGEDASDKETIYALLRVVTGNPRLPAPKGRNFKGQGNLLNGGARELRTLKDGGCDRFIICLDADGPDPGVAEAKARERIVKPSGISSGCCVVVPVRAIEAWILADIDQAITRWKRHSTWKTGEVHNPEMIADPKSKLREMSSQGQEKFHYDHVNHNPTVAAHLDTARVAGKCPSFRVLRDFALQS